jgi:hypothetical protein
LARGIREARRFRNERRSFIEDNFEIEIRLPSAPQNVLECYNWQERITASPEQETPPFCPDNSALAVQMPL